MDKKQFKLKDVIEKFAPERKSSYILSLITSAIAGILSILPFLFIYNLLRHFALSNFSIDQEILYKNIWAIFISQIAAVVFTFLGLFFSHSLAFRVEKNMRYIGMKRLMELPLGFFEKEDSGRLRRQIDDESSRTHTFIAHNMPDGARGMMIPLSFIGIMIYIDWKFALINLGAIVIGLGIMGSMMGGKMKPLMDEFIHAGEDLSVTGTEYIRGIPIVKVFQQTVESFQDFYHAILRFDQVAKEIVFSWREKMIIAILVLGLPALILGPTALYFMESSDLPALLFAKASLMILLSFLTLVQLILVMKIQESHTRYIQSISGIFRLEKEAVQGVISTPQKEEVGVVFENVNFTYPNREEKAISNFSFHFMPKTSYALVGPSGSGKSTMIKLLARLYDVESGAIRIDGQDIRSMEPEEVYEKMAIVFQENSLLDTTLRENVAMGYEARDEEIIDALKNAASRDILERIGSLDANIGKEGTYVSGGEKQRINIARAYLRKRPILLLDEASAYADAENEKEIEQSLEKIKTESMTISIAHRLTSIKKADCILIMENGGLKDFGNHEELMEKSDLYKNLVEEYEKAANWTFEEVRA
ncbi:MAG: ABC transporter ATP-binding protein [Tissierellia bacterium]|nr:ABC transporter ATP-binding protein [Tissierellia bacterium]